MPPPLPEGVSILKYAVVAWVLCGSLACHSSDSPEPEETVAVSPRPEQLGGRLAFQRGSDPVSRALTEFVDAYSTAPETEDALRGVQERARRSLEQLRADPDAATSTVIASLDLLAAQDLSNHLAAFRLLALVGTARGLERLRDEALRPLPVVPPSGTPREEGPLKHLSTIRLAAVSALRHAALEGSGQARPLLMQLVQGAESPVRARSVEAVYAASPQRWRAKREMAAVLPPAELHLLTSVYP